MEIKIMSRNCWGYRINKEQITFFRQELLKGRLRQGWGWDERQNLRCLSMNEGARRNLPIFNKVKKGDILLIPRLPTWNEVAIVEATQDFDEGYDFSIAPELGDFGHIFPVKHLKSFVRQNEYIPGNIRATLKNVSRFWSIRHCAEDIEKVIASESSKLTDSISLKSRFNNILTGNISNALNESNFYDRFYNELNSQLSNEEWEYALVEGLRKILPEPITVERTGGITEKLHGTDILITLPGLLGMTYGIAIQVKDYEGLMSDSAVKQINKADDYWNNENLKIVDKYVFVTRCKKKDHLELIESSKDVKIIFAHEMKDLLKEIADGFIGLPAS